MVDASSSDEASGLPQLTVYFDGYCNLCNAWVDRILRKERGAKFYFAPLTGRNAEHTLPERFRGPELDAIVLQEGRTFLSGPEAALRILRFLAWPYRPLYLLRFLPRGSKEWGYRTIARNRYRWFGKREECRVPTPEEQERFLD